MEENQGRPELVRKVNETDKPPSETDQGKKRERDMISDDEDRGDITTGLTAGK